MIIQVQSENYEELTNIGIAKAIVDDLQLGVADLEEIAEHLLLVVKCKRIYTEMAVRKNENPKTC